MQLADSRSQLDAMRAKHAEEEAILTNRIVSIYKAGEVNVIEVLINSGGFNDFYVQMSYIKKVNDQDYKLLEQYKESANIISDLTDEIDVKRSQQLALEKQLGRDKEQVEAMIAEREGVLSQVNSEVQRILQEEAERQLQEQLQARAEAEALLRELEISDEVQAQVVLTAMQYLGVPYVWGGESPNGFDCSGLTKFVYAKHGVSLPHYAASQSQMGVEVPDDMLQPGDLIFWGPGHPHHVGMYIGQGKYIEASGFGGIVKISTLTIDSDYAGARRFELQAAYDLDAL
jgi:cell wall-associated NlpC family hydrolase